MRSKQATYLELCYSQGVSHRHLHLAELKAGRGVGKFQREKSEGSGMPQWAVVSLRKLKVGRLERGHPMVWGAYSAFLAWS